MEESAIILILIVLLFIVMLLFYFRSRIVYGFINKLTKQMQSQKQSRKPLKVGYVPIFFGRFYQTLNDLLLYLPVEQGHDKLTGLLNREGFRHAVTQHLKIDSGSLVLVDMCRFRLVNDLFGFHFGDQLLQQFAMRLQQLDCKPQLLTRMKQDEFLMYFPKGLTQSQLVELQMQLQQAFYIQSQPVSLKVKLGCVDIHQLITDVSLTFKHLDCALKKAKLNRSALAYYNEDDERHQMRQLQIINKLAKALSTDALHMVYQPKLDVISGRCLQVEALIRWQDNELGLISPAEFIPLAEYAGTIDLVTLWALEQVFKQQQQWQLQGVEVQTAINFSSQDLNDMALVELFEQKLAQYQLPARLFEIEITEGLLIINFEQTIAVLLGLKALGVSLAIDDFGTGHSSLSYLKKLPVDEVKIDREFLEDIDVDPRSQHLLLSSITLGKGLGMRVTIEGVESHKLLEQVIEMGVDSVQGDVYSKPLLASEIVRLWPQLSSSSSLMKGS
ncbi:putative bifunctional diguanylate cyclase/phosphodiesterase [Shewanella marina]|uniref:putative bifunctional diguanylate cyclase/phosphodiesterase n=1 Tax=Shewanella marina TaxID=487319 RepID=UPI00046EE0DD|nr:bifunctional diguanylate cyclase/phosphodiesterase [Shewanella marina]